MSRWTPVKESLPKQGQITASLGTKIGSMYMVVETKFKFSKTFKLRAKPENPKHPDPALTDIYPFAPPSLEGSKHPSLEPIIPTEKH